MKCPEDMVYLVPLHDPSLLCLVYMINAKWTKPGLQEERGGGGVGHNWKVVNGAI